MAFIAPSNEFRQYEQTFSSMIRSLSVSEGNRR
jgi:hypothetical protein